MLAKRMNFSLVYKRCRVLARNNADKSYFIEYLKDIETKSVEYCWCRANQALKMGSVIDGYLCPTESFDCLPTLIVGECNSIIPSIRSIALMSR